MSVISDVRAGSSEYEEVAAAWLRVTDSDGEQMWPSRLVTINAQIHRSRQGLFFRPIGAATKLYHCTLILYQEPSYGHTWINNVASVIEPA